MILLYYIILEIITIIYSSKIEGDSIKKIQVLFANKGYIVPDNNNLEFISCIINNKNKYLNNNMLIHFLYGLSKLIPFINMISVKTLYTKIKKDIMEDNEINRYIRKMDENQETKYNEIETDEKKYELLASGFLEQKNVDIALFKRLKYVIDINYKPLPNIEYSPYEVLMLNASLGLNCWIYAVTENGEYIAIIDLPTNYRYANSILINGKKLRLDNLI